MSQKKLIKNKDGLGGGREFLRDLLRKATDLFTQQWFCFLKVAVLFIIPILILNEYFWKNSALIQKIINTYSIPMFSLINGAVNLLLLIFIHLYLVTVIKVTHAADQGRRLGAFAAYGQARSIFGQYLWVKILFVFKVLCWAVLLLIPGIIFGVLNNFSGLALLIDNKQGTEALILSQKIIKQNITRYLACFLPACIMSTVVCVLFIMYFDSMAIFFTLNGNLFIARAIGFIVFFFVVVIWAYFFVFYYYLYKALGGATEGQ